MNNYSIFKCLLLAGVFLSNSAIAQGCLSNIERQFVNEAKDCQTRNARLYKQVSEDNLLSVKLSGQSFLRCSTEFHASARQATNPHLRKFLKDMAYSYEPMGELMLVIHALNAAVQENNYQFLTDLGKTLATSDAKNMIQSIGSTAALQQRINQTKKISDQVYLDFKRDMGSAIDQFNQQRIPNCDD